MTSDSLAVTPLSIWHYASQWAVLVPAATIAFGAVIGVFGISFSGNGDTTRRRLIWLLVSCGVVLAFGSGWLTARALQESDVRYEQTVRNFTNLQQGLNKVAVAAHVATNVPLADVIAHILERLPGQTNVAGDANAVSSNQLGGVTAGTIGNLTIRPPPWMPKTETKISYISSEPLQTEVIVSYPPSGDPEILFNGFDPHRYLWTTTGNEQMSVYLFEGSPQVLGLHAGHNRVTVRYGRRVLLQRDAIVTQLAIEEGERIPYVH